MAESYFELLTEQRGLPAKPFDPLEELRCLRRRLALRIQNLECSGQEFPEAINTSPLPDELRTNEIPLTEPATLEMVAKQVGAMKKTMRKTLVMWQRSRLRTKSPREDLFRSRQRGLNRSGVSTMLAQYLTPPQEGMLEMLQAGLTALGVIGVVFGALSFFRGWESDLSLGSMVCASGATVVAIGVAGILFASHDNLPADR